MRSASLILRYPRVRPQDGCTGVVPSQVRQSQQGLRSDTPSPLHAPLIINCGAMKTKERAATGAHRIRFAGHGSSGSVNQAVCKQSVHFSRHGPRAVPHLDPLGSSRMPHVSEVCDSRGESGSNGRSPKEHGTRGRLLLRNGGIGRRASCSKSLACPLGEGTLVLRRKGETFSDRQAHPGPFRLENIYRYSSAAPAGEPHPESLTLRVLIGLLPCSCSASWQMTCVQTYIHGATRLARLGRLLKV